MDQLGCGDSQRCGLGCRCNHSRDIRTGAITTTSAKATRRDRERKVLVQIRRYTEVLAAPQVQLVKTLRAYGNGAYLVSTGNRIC